MPTIEYVGGRRSHVFKCTSKGCKKTVHRFLDKGDAHSTGNLHRHVKMCWGEDVFHQVLKAKNIMAAHEVVKNYAANGSITTAFEQKNKVQWQFSHRQHMKWQTRLDLHRYGNSEADT